MEDVIFAVGLVFVVEGILYALFPKAMRNMMQSVIKLPDSIISYSGLMVVVIGASIIYAIKH